MKTYKLEGSLKNRILIRYRMRQAVDNSTINGMKYLGTRCNRYGRSFWVLVLCGSFASMVFILLFTIDTFDETISVSPDTSFLRWNSTFPAISICYSKGRTGQISNFLKEQWIASNFTPAKNTAYLWPKLAQTYLFLNPNTNLDNDITSFFPTDCKEVLFDVKVGGVKYDCDRIFNYTLTEMGNCFTANSIHDQ
ncbi:uncharacterized protein LOC131294129 [Anopheles ziemanni]|uniref:uncharacterized protein LOC131264855 n=1 Tax=Anopheles coustani TaxID=139045 RepID=UPI002658BE8E|nr:uncharacterized protein LOC131264855 [Anopheles coustani]XP_058178157.1 uncharacterized protein LOC131294129 [Anopheles ziemanni]